jgi:hypothetical protein
MPAFWRAPPGVIHQARYWDWLSWALLAAVLLFVLATFGQHGISNDEPVQHTYGRLLLAFYGSGFADRHAFDYLNLHLYGGLFDILAAALEPYSPWSVWDLRHLLSALFGVVGIVFASLTARQLAGPRAGCLTGLVLGLTGAWTGAMFTHTKDIPFGAAMMASVYFSTGLLRQLPRPSAGTLIGAGLALGSAMGLRVGGLFALFYMGTGLLLVGWSRSRSINDAVQLLRQCLPRVLLAIALALVVMAITWPWSVMGWRNLFDAATKFSHFNFDMKTQLAGTLYPISQLPRTYLAHYLLLRVPELLLLGLFAATVIAARALRQDRGPHLPGLRVPVAALPQVPVVLAAVFPVLFSLATAPALYNGIRHFSFVLPPLAVLAGMGLDALLTALKGKRPLLLAATALLLSVGTDNLLLMLRLHPYQYVAYNHLAGGLEGAYRRYELDYWNDGARESAHLLNHLLRDELGTAPAGFTVAFCGESVQVNEFLDPRFRVVRDWPSADFFVSATQTGCDKAMNGTLIGQVEREGVPLMVIKDRRELVGPDRLVIDDSTAK